MLDIVLADDAVEVPTRSEYGELVTRALTCEWVLVEKADRPKAERRFLLETLRDESTDPPGTDDQRRSRARPNRPTRLPAQDYAAGDQGDRREDPRPDRGRLRLGAVDDENVLRDHGNCRARCCEDRSLEDVEKIALQVDLVNPAARNHLNNDQSEVTELR